MKRVNWLALGIALVALLAAAYAVWEPYTVRQEATSLADQVTEACAKGGPGAAQLGAACAKAAEVKDQVPVAQAAEPDPAALRQAARTAVADFCAAPSRPCRGPEGASPNVESIVDAVVAKLPAPRDGRDAPTPDVVGVVTAYCGQATEPCRGPAGKDGESPPCLKEPARCQGADGEDGQPPAGWTTDYPGGATETCTRADPFDPASPRYECSRSSDLPSPDPNPPN